MARQPSTSSEEEDNVVHGTFYRAKCASHGPALVTPTGPSHLSRVLQQRNLCAQGLRSSSHPSSRQFRPGPVAPVTTHTLHLESTGRKSHSRLSVHPHMESDDEEEIIGLTLPRSPLADLDPSNLPCSCSDPNCKQQQDHITRQETATATASQESSYASGSPLYTSLHADGTQLRQVRTRLIESAGGMAVALKVYQCCLDLYKRQPEILQLASVSADGDTLLMQLLSRTGAGSPASQPQSRLDVRTNQLLMGQVLAFIRLYLEVGNGELLFVRNQMGLSTLELAGLANQADVAEYLLYFYRPLGRDPNATNDQGHTILHLMARKGDDCADTLERLLALRSNDDTRLLRIDMVNSGGKTPLDVACACEDIFVTGAERTLYSRVIRLFHDTIKAEAREIFGEEASFSSGSDFSRSNSFTEVPNISRQESMDTGESANSGLTFRNF